MKKVVSFLLFTLLCACGPTLSDSIESISQPMTGTDAKSFPDGVFENVVQISPPDGRRCSAIVLSGHWLLTSAHCVEHRVKAIDGFFDPGKSYETSFRQWLVFVSGYAPDLTKHHRIYSGPAAIYISPGYTVNTSDNIEHARNDIALIRLYNDGLAFKSGAPFRVSSNLFGEQLNIADSLGQPAEVDRLIAAGYGHRPPSTSQQTDYCQDTFSYFAQGGYYGKTVPSHSETLMFSTKSPDSVSLCRGDSGGPSFVELERIKMVLGVASNGDRPDGCLCIEPNEPAHYTRIYPKLDWMLETTARSGLPLVLDAKFVGEYKRRYYRTSQLFDDYYLFPGYTNNGEPVTIFTVESVQTLNPQLHPDVMKIEDKPQWLLDLISELE